MENESSSKFFDFGTPQLATVNNYCVYTAHGDFSFILDLSLPNSCSGCNCNISRYLLQRWLEINLLIATCVRFPARKRWRWSSGPALSRCNQCSCIGPRAYGGPAPWCL